jgi:hypothetical protein
MEENQNCKEFINNMEEFVPIKDFENYTINKFGVIKNDKNKVIKPYIQKSKQSNHKGYFRLAITTNGQRKSMLVHILMAKTFLDYDSYQNPVVDHKDNDSFNNDLNNLQITTKRHNSSKDITRKVNNLLGTYKRGKTYVSRIKINGKKVYLGSYKTELEAHNVYMKALNNIHLYNDDNDAFKSLISF